jgi:hypothetical protein
MKKPILLTILGWLTMGVVWAEPMIVKSEIVAFSIPESSVVQKIESRTNLEVVGVLSDTIGFEIDSFDMHSDGMTLHNQLNEKGGMLFGIVNLFMELNNQTESVFQYPIFDIPPKEGPDATASGPENSEPDWNELPGMKLLLTARELNPEHTRFRLDYEFEIGLIPPESYTPVDGQASSHSRIIRHTVEESIEVELDKWYVITVSALERVEDGSVHQIWILIRLNKPVV